MSSICVVDTYYPAFLDSWRFNPACTPETQLKELLEFSFGTGDFYSRNLRALGWQATDIILNTPLGCHVPDSDVLFMQDLSQWPTGKHKILAGQCSCPWPGDERVKQYDVIFTSFPHYVPRIEALGVKAVYNPLAFDPIVLKRTDILWAPRIYDCVFIGGVGAPSHWKRGMETLNAVAEAIPGFRWWGYGADLLPQASALFQKWQGPAFGMSMYDILLQSKLCINRHGEVAAGFANNQRLFESTGCGAMLLTEEAPNLSDFFDDNEAVTYNSAADAVEKIQHYLSEENELEAECIAENGALRTLTDHTYDKRMKTVSDTLLAML